MFKFKTHQLDNFKFVQRVCRDAMKYEDMVGIIAPPGVGKTFALQHFESTNANVYSIQLGTTVTPKEMFIRILTSISETGLREKGSIGDILWRIELELAKKSSKTLIIIDEAGMFKKEQISCFHELRNLSQHKCGIVLSGPIHFENNILGWIDKGVQGMEEFYSRISYWLELIRPTNPEIKAVFKNEGLGKIEKEKELLEKILKTPYEKRSWRRIEMLIKNFLLQQEHEKGKK